MNVRVSEEFGMYFARIPLKTSPHIVHGNALMVDWNDVLPAERASYVFGNPPFLGKKEQSAAQKANFESVMVQLKSFGVLDFVCAWYVKAARYIKGSSPLLGTNLIRCAFVSTNSITQGEQVGVLWGWLLVQGIRIHFAHRTFQWSNEARGMAAVHCVIIGFGAFDAEKKTIYEYEDIRGEAHAVVARNINPYLVNYVDVVLQRRSQPIYDVPSLVEGITPLDNGILAFSKDEYRAFLIKEPTAEKWFRPWLTGNDFINGQTNYCLWLSDATPSDLKSMPNVMTLLSKVQEFRENSKSSQKFATKPWLFRETTIPEKFILIPKTSSERRQFFPIGFVENCVVTNSALYMEGGSFYHFGILASTMHNTWVRYTCGRLKSDYRYSAGIVYNNFPWPDEPTDKQRAALETGAQTVLDARAQFPQSSLADLYDPLTMPPTLVKAHQNLDRAVDTCYRKAAFTNDAQRVEFLFERYQQLTSLLPMEKKTIKRRLKTN